ANVQQAIEEMVVEEGRAAGDMAEGVLTLGGLADLVQVVVALVREVFLAKLDHALLLAVAPLVPPAGGIQDRVDDRLVAGAAADVTGNGLRHLVPGRTRVAVEQRLRRK